MIPSVPFILIFSLLILGLFILSGVSTKDTTYKSIGTSWTYCRLHQKKRFPLLDYSLRSITNDLSSFLVVKTITHQDTKDHQSNFLPTSCNNRRQLDTLLHFNDSLLYTERLSTDRVNSLHHKFRYEERCRYSSDLISTFNSFHVSIP